MKIKNVLIALVVALCVAFTGCGSNPAESRVIKEKPSMFVIIESNSMWFVVYHKETKVMYTVSFGAYNSGNFTVLVNPDGTPMLYEEEK